MRETSYSAIYTSLHSGSKEVGVANPTVVHRKF